MDSWPPGSAAAPHRRPTLRDIARRAGISEAAASFALNDRPGVSEATRAKVRAIADELGWRPLHAARALSGASAGTVGLVFAREVESLGTESFFLRLLTGIQDVLSRQRRALLLQAVGSIDEELELYRAWHAERRVDGVVLVDLRVADPRPAALRAIGLPCVIAGGPEPSGAAPSVSVDDGAAMRLVMRHLHERGYRSVHYMCGSASLRHVATRRAQFHQALHEFSFRSGAATETDYTATSGTAASLEALVATHRPEALIFDNEVLALAGLGVASRLGLCVPDDLGLVSFEDTAACQAVDPALTALRRDPFAFGADTATRLLAVIDGAEPCDVAESLPHLIERESTARA